MKNHTRILITARYNKVEGLIIAKEMSEKLKFALMVNSNIKFMEYVIDFQLKSNEVICRVHDV